MQCLLLYDTTRSVGAPLQPVIIPDDPTLSDIVAALRRVGICMTQADAAQPKAIEYPKPTAGAQHRLLETAQPPQLPLTQPLQPPLHKTRPLI